MRKMTAMTDRGTVLDKLRADETTLKGEFAVRSLALFGSGAGDDAGRARDIDLLVEFDRPVGLLHFSRTARHLSDVLGAPVDLIARRAILPELRDDILSQAVDVF